MIHAMIHRTDYQPAKLRLHLHLRTIATVLGVVFAILWCPQLRAEFAEQEGFTPTKAIDYVNQYREQVRLPAFSWDSRLDQSADLHSQYLLSANGGQPSHYETRRSDPFYRGNDPHERITRAYPQATSSGEVLGMQSKGRWQKIIDDLIGAPFHRLALLGDYQRAGAGFRRAEINGDTSMIGTVNLADQEPNPTSRDKPIAWPYDGQTDVPIDWLAFEQPSPISQKYYGRRSGYPLTLQWSNQTILSNLHLTLSAVGGGGSDEHSDRTGFFNFSTQADFYRKNPNVVVFVPNRPLRGNQTYRARVTGLANRHPFDISWQFKTRPVAPLVAQTVPAKNLYRPGESIQIRLLGGSGNFHTESKTRYNIRYQSGNDQRGQVFELTENSDSEYQLVNRCNSKINCTVQIDFFDSAGRGRLMLNLSGS